MITRNTRQHFSAITLLALLIFLLPEDKSGRAAVSQQVQSTGPMALPRKGHTATVLADGRVLIVGGQDGSGVLSAAEIYDPVTQSFQLAGSLAAARYGHTATLLADGRVLIAGGADATGPLSSAEIFDPAA